MSNPNMNPNPQSGGQDDAQTSRYFDNPYGYPYGYPYGPGQPNPNDSNGEWKPVSPFKLMESWLPQRAKNAIRGAYGIIGVIAIVLGLALFIWPGATLKIAAIALGAYFVVSGVVRIVTAIVELGLPGGWRVLDILVGLLLSVGGVVMLKNSALSGATLAVVVTMVVGVGWMMEGVMALVESWRMPSSAWAVIYALISIIAGCVMLFCPVASTGWMIIVRRLRAGGARHCGDRPRVHVRQGGQEGLISRNRNAGHTTGRIAFFCRTIRRFDTDAESCDFFFMPPRIAGKIRYETKDATED